MFLSNQQGSITKIKFIKQLLNKMKKELGQFFTPIEIVNYILDNSGFRKEELIKINHKKLINLLKHQKKHFL